MINIQMLADAIAKCRNKFDTQYVVRILMQDNPIEYVQHLNAAGVKDPIRHGTTLISKMLSENMVALRIKKAIRDKRPDVRVLKKTDNQAWEKQ